MSIFDIGLYIIANVLGDFDQHIKIIDVAETKRQNIGYKDKFENITAACLQSSSSLLDQILLYDLLDLF